jgi:hypothetical protein
VPGAVAADLADERGDVHEAQRLAVALQRLL